MVRLRDLELEDEVGQLFWIGFEGAVFGPALQRLVRLIRPGGLILFSRNIGEARQVRALTDDLFRSIGVPPFLAVDQEGGRVNRLLPILGPTPVTLVRRWKKRRSASSRNPYSAQPSSRTTSSVDSVISAPVAGNRSITPNGTTTS